VKIALPATGVALLTVGVIWILQGINVLPGSFMTGQAFWAWAGILSAFVGAILLYFGLNRRAQH
jgi:uncharacterized membrane protein HdeD (DUF308 family)